MSALTLVGRQSSHYTRVARMFAAELGVPYKLTPILDLMSLDAQTFADNPALKLPILRRGDDYIYGTLNICRVFADEVGARQDVGWPESFETPRLMNAHELLAHAMAAEVEIVVHEFVEKRPVDNASRKRRSSLVNCLRWLDANLAALRPALAGHRLTWFDVGLFCLLEHLPFRNPMDLSGLRALTAFAEDFGARPSAQATPYRFDQ